MKIPGYTSYANQEALKLARWALDENDRVKAGKMKKIADKMEDKYRNSREFKQIERNNEFNRRNGGSVRILYESLIMIQPPPPPMQPQRRRAKGSYTPPKPK